MKLRTSSVPVRLSIEVVLTAAAAHAAAALAVTAWAGAAGAGTRLALTALLALLVAMPLVSWRCFEATRRVAAAAGRPALSPAGTHTLVRVAVAAFAVQALGLALTAVAVAWHQRSLEQATRARFERHVERLAQEVRSRFEVPLMGLKGLRGSQNASVGPTREAVASYVSMQDLARDFVGVRGFGFVETVRRAELEAFVARQRAAGPLSFDVRSSGHHDPLYVVSSVAPLARNRRAQGFDLGQEAQRREAVERAIDSGEAALTGPITLQDQARGNGFLLLLPAYRGGTAPPDPAQRRAALIGLYFASIGTDELLAGVVARFDGEIDFELFDRTADDRSRLIFDADGHLGGAPGAAGAVTAADFTGRLFTQTSRLDIAGRRLALRISSTPLLDQQARSAPVWLTGLAGAALSLFAALATWLLGAGRLRAENRARRMTAELDRLARVAQHTANSVVISDAAMRITWVNAGFTRMTGYDVKDAQGRRASELVGHPDADPRAKQALLDACAAGVPCRVEVLNRRRDGSDYWIDLDLQPVRDAAGALSGFLAIGTEITQQRETQRRLEAALRDTEVLLNTIHTHAIVSVADRHGTITEVNDAFCEISGYAREELVGATHAVVNSGTHDAAFWRWVWGTISLGEPWRGRICNRGKDGRLYWVDSIIAPFAGADGRIEKYISIRHDITASVLAAEALARERQRLDHIVEGTNVGTWEWNVETGETRIDERWAQMIGFTLDELGPWSIEAWSRFSHPDDLSRSAVALERHFNGETPHYECETRMRHKDGHWIWMLDRGKLFSRAEDGRPRWMAGTHMDISDRKAAEAALRAGQALLDRVGRIAQVGGWEIDLRGGQMHWTDEIRRMLDLPDELPPTLAALLERMTPDARAAMQTALETARHQGLGWDVEWPFVTAGGRPLWLRCLGEVALDDEGPALLVGALQDVTSRRLLQDELRRKNDLLESVLESLPCGLSVFDADLRLVAHNRQYRSLLDYPDSLFETPQLNYEDIIRFIAQRGDYGDGAAEVMDGDIEERIARLMEDARQPLRRVLEHLRPNGKPLEFSRAPLAGGGFVTTYTDITERKRAQAEIERAAALLRGAIETVDEAFVLYDPDDRLVLCNDKYRALYATSAPAIVPGNTFEQIIRYGAERGQYAEAVGRLDEWVTERLAAHRQGDRAFLQTLDDGRVLRVIERAMPDGHIVGFRIDVTDLERARVAAEEASRAKSRFLANMSHEIRTPMNAVLGMLRLLRRTGLGARQNDYAAKAEGAARALLDLLNDVLDVSKIEAGKLALEPRPFQRDALLQDVSVILAAGVGDKPVELLFDIDPHLPATLVGDELRLRQILVNLAGNAVKFTERGEVVVALHQAAQDDAGLLIDCSVRDSGIGIAPENQSRIFSAFTQAEASTTRKYGGTGLGVAICQHLVGLMGGTLALQSAPGVGSTFSFRIRLDAAPPAAALPAPAPSAPAAAVRCLVVDDHADARRLLVAAAQALGWQAEADAGADGGEVPVQPYDIAFIDAHLADGGGAACAERLRRSGHLDAASRVVLVAPHALGAGAAQALADAGTIDAVLVKPFTTTTLAAAAQAAHAARSGECAAPRPQPAAAARLSGLRLLLVEDNPNNRQIALELLADEGAEVESADNGAAGVQAVASAVRPFDAVLMDLQMPVMDGLTAAAEIRTRLGLQQLPIIAMTANAMDADRAACLAAGMNDHIGKPFDLDRLVHTLLRHTRGGADAAPAQTAPAPSAAFDADSALARFGGKRATYLRALRAFLAELPATAGPLARALADGDRATAQRLLHTQKGLAATLGALALAAQAQALERALADAAVDAAALVARWRDAVAAAMPDIAACAAALDDAPTPPPAAADAGARRSTLQALAQCLRDGDMQAERELEVLRGLCDSADSARLTALEDAIAVLDFTRAQAVSAQWLEQIRGDTVSESHK